MNTRKEASKPRPYGTARLGRRGRFRDKGSRRLHPRFEGFHPLPQVLEHQHPIFLEEFEYPRDRNPIGCSADVTPGVGVSRDRARYSII